MNKVNIQTVSGNMVINNSGIFIDGVQVECDSDMKGITVIVEGDIHGSLTLDNGSIECGNVQGDVDSGNSLKCKDVNGDAHAGNSINCGNIKGKAKAGNSINCSSHN